MVEFGSGPVKEHIDNSVFIIPAIIIIFLVASAGNDTGVTGGRETHATNLLLFLVFTIVSGGLIAFFTYKLVSSLRQKQKAKEDKRRQKQQKKEKETQRKQKKK